MSQAGARFIRANLTLKPVPALPHIRLYTAHSGSRLSQLAASEVDEPPAPYWAYQWAGGLALALHFEAHPELVVGKRVLDLGAGSGVVGIVAAKAGARVSAAEIDPNGRAAIILNAAANGISLTLLDVDLDGGPPAVDLIAAGDVFYNRDVAARMLPYLQRCHAAGIAVFIGDPDRRDLPVGQLDRVASYAVGDVGDPPASAQTIGAVYLLKAR